MPFLLNFKEKQLKKNEEGFHMREEYVNSVDLSANYYYFSLS